MEQLTVLQEAIVEIKVFREKASFEYKAATTNEDKEEWLSSISAIDSCLTVLKSKLPKEREQIEEAYKADLYPCSDEDATEYYTNKYGQNEKTND